MNRTTSCRAIALLAHGSLTAWQLLAVAGMVIGAGLKSLARRERVTLSIRVLRGVVLSGLLLSGWLFSAGLIHAQSSGEGTQSEQPKVAQQNTESVNTESVNTEPVNTEQPRAQRTIAIVGGDLYPVDAPQILGGTVLMRGSKIAAIGTDVEVPEDAEVVDARGLRVYPGLFNASGHLGLIEINSIRATDDTAEAGRINPNVEVQRAVNPDSELIPVTRANGVLLSLASPQGGLVAGRSAVLQHHGWTWEAMTLAAPTGLHVAWPLVGTPPAWWNAGSGPGSGNRAAELEELERVWEEAKRYRQAHSANASQPRDLRWDAMLPVLNRELPLIVEADYLEQIKSAVAFAARHDLRLIIRGGYDAVYCAELLRERQVPVILDSVLRLPFRRHEGVDHPYRLAELLRLAEVKYCIAGAGRFDAANMRNLPYHASMAVAHGLPADEALRAITLYPAEILGVADRVGSLAPGKDATLFLAEGDILQIPTQVRRAYIAGEPIDLSSRHTRLYEKYQGKYRSE